MGRFEIAILGVFTWKRGDMVKNRRVASSVLLLWIHSDLKTAA